MSETRIIEVDSCRFCKYRKTSSLYDKGFCTNGEGFQLGEDFPSIPDSCPLPPWPSVMPEDIDYFCTEMELLVTSKSAKGSEQRNDEESYVRWLCEKIGVEVREVRDERD